MVERAKTGNGQTFQFQALENGGLTDAPAADQSVARRLCVLDDLAHLMFATEEQVRWRRPPGLVGRDRRQTHLR